MSFQILSIATLWKLACTTSGCTVSTNVLAVDPNLCGCAPLDVYNKCLPLCRHPFPLGSLCGLPYVTRFTVGGPLRQRDIFTYGLTFRLCHIPPCFLVTLAYVVIFSSSAMGPFGFCYSCVSRCTTGCLQSLLLYPCWFCCAFVFEPSLNPVRVNGDITFPTYFPLDSPPRRHNGGKHPLNIYFGAWPCLLGLLLNSMKPSRKRGDVVCSVALPCCLFLVLVSVFLLQP